MTDFAPHVRWDRIGRLALLFVGLLLIYLYINPARTYVVDLQEARTKRDEVSSCSASTPTSCGARTLCAPGAASRPRRAGSAWSSPTSAPT